MNQHAYCGQSKAEIGPSLDSTIADKQWDPAECRAVPVKELLWRMRWHSVSLGLCFAVTIAVFPSITASICSVHNPATRPPCLPHTRYGRLAGDHRLSRFCAKMNLAKCFYSARHFLIDKPQQATQAFCCVASWMTMIRFALGSCTMTALSMHPAGDLFTPLLFLLFNLGDLLGRLLSGIGPYVHKSPRPSMLMGYALSRIVLAAALIFCHVVTPHAWRAPELFG